MLKIKYYLIIWATIYSGCLELNAQEVTKIHDLKGITDSTGVVHLYYRLTQEYSDGESNHVYQYHTETNVEERAFEVLSSWPVSEYKIFNNNPDSYIYIVNWPTDDGSSIARHDSIGETGGHLIFIKHLNIAGSDTGMVYAEFNHEMFRSFDGGITWPDYDEIIDGTYADSSKLDFPLVSLSPYDENLMFGLERVDHLREPHAWLRSTDAGETHEVISDSLFPETLYYDADSSHVYFIWSGGLYVSPDRGSPGSWERIKDIEEPAYISLDQSTPGHIYITQEDTVFQSTNYGETFEEFYAHDEIITGLYKSEGDHPVYFITDQAMFMVEDSDAVRLKDITVSVQPESKIPRAFELNQNYPNPFNPSTTISFSLFEAMPITLTIYDINGRFVSQLLNEQLHNPGTYDIRWNAQGNSSGTYLYEIKAGNYSQIKSMTLIK